MDLQKLVNENQSIKVVPSIEESLRLTGFDVELDETTQTWFLQLKKVWKTWRKSTTVQQSIESFFHSITYPHRISLVLIIKCDEFKDCKPKTLPFCIIETLQYWAEKNSISPDESLKISAYEIALQQRNSSFFSLVAKTYQLYTIKKDIIPKINEIIKDGNYKLATQITIAMQLFDDISLEDILFPLVLQDKHNIIDDYLSKCPHKVIPFLSFLDKLLDKNFGIRSYAQTYIENNKITDVRYDKLHHKPLGKLVARLCNKFKIPIETCKNLSKNRTMGGLRYLIHQKYQENNVSASVWEDLVKDSLKQNADSAIEFIDMLCDYDQKEALKWAEYLAIPESDYPPGLRQVTTTCDTDTSENWDTNSPQEQQEFYKLNVHENQIILVDSGEKFYNMMQSSLAKSRIVAIDCEWKPSFGATQSQVALIQVATDREIYLIDTILLNCKEYSSFWYTFNKSLLDNAEIVKIGFGLEQDLREMKSCIVGLNNIKVKGEGLLDLSLLWRSLLNSGFAISSSSDVAGNSLSSLVQLCFGLPLAKSEQCSNWELRPLRSTQIQYAALDAYVLLEIYYYLQKICCNQGIKFDEICNDIMLEGKQKTTKKSKVAERIQTSVLQNFQVRPINQIKFFVEPTLSGLLSYLRYCGIDSIPISSTMLWHDIINVAISEDRLILLSKLKLSPTINYPQTNILDVGVCSIKSQMKKIFLNFKIDTSDLNFLNRCTFCNEENLRSLSSDEVQEIYSEVMKMKFSTYRYGPDECDDDDNYDNFLSDSDCDEDLYQPQKKTFVKNILSTSKGVPIQCDGIEKLQNCKKNAFLCDSCGQLLWEDEENIRNIGTVIESLTNLSLR